MGKVFRMYVFTAHLRLAIKNMLRKLHNNQVALRTWYCTVRILDLKLISITRNVHNVNDNKNLSDICTNVGTVGWPIGQLIIGNN